MEKFLKNLQLLSFDEQLSEIKITIDGIHKLNNRSDTEENINRYYSAINYLKALRSKRIKDNKGIITFPYTLFVLIHSVSLDLKQKYNEKNKPKSSNIDSFKYSILISLHYYDIYFHPERISKLKPFENKYTFAHSTPNEFKIINPNV